METETEFLLRRASEESRRAINSIQPQAEVAHGQMALRYSVKAIIALSDDDEVPDGADGSTTEPQLVDDLRRLALVEGKNVGQSR